MIDAFICDAVRTPFGRYGGALAAVRTDDLAAIPIKALVERNRGVDWSAVDRGFLDYAIRDAIVTHAVYQVARTEAIGLMEKHGYDPTPRA